MRVPRLHVIEPLAANTLIALGRDAAHHVGNVLRMRAGDPIVLFNDGIEGEGRIVSLSKAGVSVAVESCAAVSRESPLRITLAQGISRGERMDYTIQKAVELGVSTIAPIITGRTTVKLDEERAEKRTEHWRRIIVSACEQCGRNLPPDLLPVQRLEDWLSPERPGIKMIMRGDADTVLADVAPTANEVTLLIGPEGGMAEHEVAAAVRAGYVAVKLGPRVLRTETAALAAIAALQALHGDFR